MNCSYLFIYGTLLRSLRGNFFFDFEKHNTFKGNAWCHAKMFEIRDYPAIIKSDEETDKVFGEVYYINNHDYLYTKLDDYEGFTSADSEQDEYLRELMYVTMLDGQRRRCWVYTYKKPIHHYEPIPSGDYEKYIKRTGKKIFNKF
jgi:gamma-glutamylcyclotransferase (GGCT)/AIG2-like uncharacterized protein YtfP